MREVDIGPITTEWYKPWSKDKSFMTNVQLDRARIMTAFYGMEAIKYCKRLRDDNPFSREETRRINAHFFSASGRIYKLPSTASPQEFYLQQSKGAVGVIRGFGILVPELAGEWELRDEIADLSERPSDLLRLLAKPSDSIDSTLAYEAQRHANIMYQLGMFNARTLNGRLRTVLSDVNRLLNMKLFEGPEGSSPEIVLESFHDDETNEVVGFPDRNNHRPLTAHLKRIRMGVRKTREVGEVRTKPRKKDDIAAIIKTWEKALNNGGAIHIDEAVQDSIGREFMLMDDSIPPEQLADLVVEIIEAEAGTESALWEIPRIDRIEADNHTGKDRGQSPKPTFNARRKIWFENIRTPIELKFLKRELFLNSMLEVGARDADTGLYTGRAHDLYELRRCRRAVRVPFPKEIYGIDDYQLNAAFVNRSKQVAYGLRSMHRAG